MYKVAIYVNASETVTGHSHNDMMPPAVQQLWSDMRAVTARIPHTRYVVNGVVAIIPLHAIALGGDDPSRIAAAIPVFVADERLVVVLFENLRPERNGEVRGITCEIGPKVEVAWITKRDIVIGRRIIFG